MNEYRYFQDNKVTSWIRTYFTINAESEEQADAIVKSLDKGKHILNIKHESIDQDCFETEEIDNTIEFIEPCENGGSATKEWYKEYGESIGNNVDNQ